jgi:23S rRNA maturation-related 3'-5' exoribonuclease YhaM
MKNKILELLRSTERPGIENLINYMVNESDFFTAPCSTQYHLCKEGGLAEHSLNVWESMVILSQYKSIWDNIKGKSSEEKENSLVITGLLHDIGKSTYRGQPNYTPNILKSTGKLSESKPYETNKERLYIPHEIVSLQIISKYIELTEEEEFAILYHNGMYVSSGRDISGKERPLQLLLHFADMWCSRFVEVE